MSLLTETTVPYKKGEKLRPSKTLSKHAHFCHENQVTSHQKHHTDLFHHSISTTTLHHNQTKQKAKQKCCVIDNSCPLEALLSGTQALLPSFPKDVAKHIVSQMSSTFHMVNPCFVDSFEFLVSVLGFCVQSLQLQEGHTLIVISLGVQGVNHLSDSKESLSWRAFVPCLGLPL